MRTDKTYLINSWIKIADGEIQPNPSSVVSQVLQSGVLSKSDIAKAWGVQEKHVIKKAAGLSERELKTFCKMALKTQGVNLSL